MKKLLFFSFFLTILTTAGFAQQKKPAIKVKSLETSSVSIQEKIKAKEAKEKALVSSTPVPGKTVIVTTPQAEKIVAVETIQTNKATPANN